MKEILDKEISLDFTVTPLPELLLFIRDRTSLEIAVDQDVLDRFEEKDFTVDLVMEDATFRDVLNTLCDFFKLACVFQENRLFLTFAKSKRDMDRAEVLGKNSIERNRKSLERMHRTIGKCVNWNFSKTRFENLLACVRYEQNINVMIDPFALRELEEKGASANLQLADCTLRDALKTLADIHDLVWVFRNNVLVLAKPNSRLADVDADCRRIWAIPPEEEEKALRNYREKLANPVSFCFSEAQMGDWVDFLRTLYGLNFAMCGLDRGKNFDIYLEKISGQNALKTFADIYGLAWVFRNNLLILAPRNSRLARMGGRQVWADMRKQDEEAFEMLRKKLDTCANWNFTEVPLSDFVYNVRDECKIHIMMDPELSRNARSKGLSVTAKWWDLPLRDALKTAADVHGLAWAFRNGVLILTDPDSRLIDAAGGNRLWEEKSSRGAEAAKRLQKALDTPASMEFSSAPLQDVVNYLQTLAYLNLALHSEVAGRDFPVDARVKDLPLRTVLDRILHPHGLGWEIRNHVVFISPRK